MSDRRLRRSQTLSPFGVGAIFDVVGESFVAEDTQRWKGQATNVEAPRIAAIMGVAGLRTAPPAPERGSKGAGVPFYRFPQWMFCPAKHCRRMTRWSLARERALQPGDPPRCTECDARRQLVPMRFVTVCGNGHLDDVDWRGWAHSGAKDPKQRTCGVRDRLVFTVSPDRGGGLESLAVRCLSCTAERPLSGVASPKTLKALGWKCRGRQPWLPAGQQDTCDEQPVIVQRGASNVHFPEVASALDIPPESDYDHYGGEAMRIRNNANFALLENNPMHPLRPSLIDMICQEEKVDRATVELILNAQLGDDAPRSGPGAVDFSEEQVRRDEWYAFTVRRERRANPRDRFVVEHTELSVRTRPAATGDAADLLARRLDHLVKATRLREVRVLRGFRRYTLKRLVAADLGARLGWLPAVEVFGEGIFVSLVEDEVSSWEQRPEVRRRVVPLEERRRNSIFSSFLPPVTPRLVMLHTLAHLLVRQLVYESGYSSSSLRERLYVAQPTDPQPMAGLLVYTGAGDSEGTLGGLVRAGDPDWFLPTVVAALQRADWCSLDPVCRETSAQGPDGLSLAACHACGLVAETSCEHNNALLDRALLVDPELGFLGDVLTAATVDTAEAAI